MRSITLIRPLSLGVAIVFLLLMPRAGFAHCDGMDGPVVKAAQRALESGDVNLVLIWVQSRDEAEVRQQFQRTVAVRKLSPEAKALADRYFFETLVRLHRAGEGAPYTGLKPAGRDLGPAIPAADKAIDAGSVEGLQRLLTEKMQAELRKQFARVSAKRNVRSDDLAVGREYVRAYVEFIHYVERMYDATIAPAGRHYSESAGEAHAEEQE